jgi:hypothetical protein
MIIVSLREREWGEIRRREKKDEKGKTREKGQEREDKKGRIRKEE